MPGDQCINQVRGQGRRSALRELPEDVPGLPVSELKCGEKTRIGPGVYPGPQVFGDSTSNYHLVIAARSDSLQSGCMGVLEVFAQPADEVANGSTAVEFIGVYAFDFQIHSVAVTVVIDPDRQRSIFGFGAFAPFGQETSFNNAAKF